jgi:hypothetical protein
MLVEEPGREGQGRAGNKLDITNSPFLRRDQSQQGRSKRMREQITRSLEGRLIRRQRAEIVCMAGNRAVAQAALTVRKDCVPLTTGR